MFACCCGKDDEIETDLVSDLDLAVERRRHSRSASICQNQVQPERQEQNEEKPLTGSAIDQDNESHKSTHSNHETSEAEEKPDMKKQDYSRRQSVRIAKQESIREFDDDDEVNTTDWNPVTTPRKSMLRKELASVES